MRGWIVEIRKQLLEDLLQNPKTQLPILLNNLKQLEIESMQKWTKSRKKAPKTNPQNIKRQPSWDWEFVQSSSFVTSGKEQIKP